MFLAARRSQGDVKILKNVWGMAGNEITAILGPSGAGEPHHLPERLLHARRRSLILTIDWLVVK